MLQYLSFLSYSNTSLPHHSRQPRKVPEKSWFHLKTHAGKETNIRSMHFDIHNCVMLMKYTVYRWCQSNLKPTFLAINKCMMSRRQ